MGLTIMKPRTEAPPPPRNGVDTPKLFATIGHVAAQPELAKFQFRTESRWIDGTHSRSAMTTFLGAGGEHSHKSEYAARLIIRPCFVVPTRARRRSNIYCTRCRRA